VAAVIRRRNPTYLRSSYKVFDSTVYVTVIIIMIITIYPILYVLSLSFSGKLAVEKGLVRIFPVAPTIDSYRLFFKSSSILRPYANTIFYTVAGTAYSLLLSLLGAYVLSKKRLLGKNFFMFLIMFTMLFGGGLIPTFLVVTNLGMFNTIWAILIPCAIGQMNLIIIRTSILQIPDSLSESAVIDGANDFQILFRIVVPLSLPVLATITLFYAVGRWNDYFTAMIYLNNEKLYPIQLVIRSLIITMDNSMFWDMYRATDKIANYTPLAFKSVVVVITMLPIMVIYPFIQKYFVKGVMIGAIKG
jgi:putative aldouronate transport system permease protein